MPDAPKVFISYSHDGAAHEERVLELANRLREDGIDAEIDQYETSPPDGWPAWCEQKIVEADFVLLVCTEIYLRRVRNKEEEGHGLGVVWEARIIRQLIYDAGARTKRFVPVLFEGGLPEHIPLPVKGATRWEVETPEGYEGLYRQLTGQPVALRPVLGKIKPMPPRESRSGPAAAVEALAAPAPCAAASSAPHAQVRDVFVGCAEHLAVLAACLLPADASRRRPVAVTGMGGVGKSYLVDRFLVEHRAAVAGGYHRLALDAERPGSADELLALLGGRLKLPAAADDAAIAAALTMGQIADILSARGQLDEALRIRREEQLPVYERLGDVRGRAVTMGKIADALAQQGNLDEAIRIYQEEVLPSYVRLGDARMLVIGRWWLASHLLRRGTTEDREQAERLLGLALADARRLRIPQAGRIEALLQRHGLPCPAAPAPSPAADPSPALREREGPASAGG